MMEETSDRRVTRSLSRELQARVAAQPQAQISHPQHQNQNYLRGLSGLMGEAEGSGKDPQNVFRNFSEEMFIKSLAEGSMGMPAENMEGIGFTNLSQTMRADSEELFNSWMSNGEGQTSGQVQPPYRTRQSSRRMSTELAALLAQQSNNTVSRVDSFDQFLQTNLILADDVTADSNRPKHRNLEEKGSCTVEFSPATKSMSWFSQSRPMTRSRSSELRRRYAAMQGWPLPPPAQTFQRDHSEHMHEMRQGSAPAEDTPISLGNKRVNHSLFFPQGNQASIPSFHMPLLGAGDSVSNFVSLLKGTLEQQKLGKGATQQQKQQQEFKESCPPWRAQEESQRRMASSPFQFSSSLQLEGMGHLQNDSYGQAQTTDQIYIEGQAPIEGLTTSHHQPGLLSQAPSPSESSTGAPVLSAGEDPCNSGQTISNRDFALKRPALHSMDTDQQPKRQKSIGSHPLSGLHGTGNGENQLDEAQRSDLSKNPHLTRVGSVNSPGGSGFTVDKEDPTKKRRVERQRKMAEAKCRNSVPTLPSDLQAALKRCEALEKEVRSLKLNLSFMNRKDSEQTKQIEELQKQNEDLQEDKERLLQKIEHFSSGNRLA